MANTSYQKINYSLRIGKSIERKMFGEVFRKLSVFKKLSAYRYIGFGSTYFTDFSMYHRLLSIKDMVSIEKQIGDKDRFIFNKPYACIRMIFDESKNVLPTLDWKKPTIIWLDYDDHLTLDALHDVNTFFSNAISGSFFLISVNAHADNYKIRLSGNNQDDNFEGEDTAEVITAEHIALHRRNKLTERVGNQKVPRGLTNSDFTSKKFPNIYYNIIKAEIEDVLTNRNLVLSDEDKLMYEQVLHIEYQDGAKMLTIGGVLFSKRDEKLFHKANFKELEFYRDDINRFKIDVPSLTFKEIRYIDSYLPSKVNADGSLTRKRKNMACLPLEDVVKYKVLYKYFPTFAEAIV